MVYFLGACSGVYLDERQPPSKGLQKFVMEITKKCPFGKKYGFALYAGPRFNVIK